ncbi:MAG: hypothetical protein AB7H92_13760 [Microbacteriaceae bacterium]
MAELIREGSELVDLVLGLGQVGGDEVAEPLLHRSAALAVPDADEVGNRRDDEAQFPSVVRSQRWCFIVLDDIDDVDASYTHVYALPA